MRHNRLGTVAGFGSAALIALLIGGCATSEYQEPTHRWVSSSQSTGHQYRADNGACMRESVGAATQRVFDTSTPEYWKYVACMNGRGYALTPSNDVASSR